jgi:hypothetical protein
VFTAIIVVAYAMHCRRKKIHYPSNLFEPFRPMRWLWLSWFPVIIVFIYFIGDYDAKFPNAAVSPVGRALSAGLFSGLLTLVVSFFIIRIPSPLTPSKFKYRPQWFFKRWAGRKVTA